MLTNEQCAAIRAQLNRLPEGEWIMTDAHNVVASYGPSVHIDVHSKHFERDIAAFLVESREHVRALLETVDALRGSGTDHAPIVGVDVHPEHDHQRRTNRS